MEITVVQTAGVTTTTGPHTKAFGSNVTAGNRIIIAIGGCVDDTLAGTHFIKNAGTATIGAFTLDVNRQNGGMCAAVASCEVTGTGSLTVEVNLAGGNDNITWNPMEVNASLGWHATPVEDTQTGTGTGTTAATANLTSAGSAIFVGALAINTGNNKTTLTEDGAWVLLGEAQNGGVDCVASTEYRITGTGLTDAASWTWTGSEQWDAVGVVYREAAASIGSAAITGTAATGTAEGHIVAGGRTIIITLTGDTWVVAAGGLFDAQRQNIIDGLDSAQSEATGWNNEVRDNLAVTDVVRTSDTVVTITLSAQAAYQITAPETITVTVPSTATALNAGDITATPTFGVALDSTAALTGTAVPSSAEAQIVAGGRTIIITLTGDTWVADGGTFDAQRQAIINGLDSAQSEANGWNAEVRDKLATSAVIRSSDTVVTITLSAAAAYSITAQETITCTVPSSALSQGLGDRTASPTFTVTNDSAAKPAFSMSNTPQHKGMMAT